MAVQVLGIVNLTVDFIKLRGLKMNMSDSFQSENTIRLLDIMYDLYGSDKRYPAEKLPFLASEDGSVVLDTDLMTELKKDGNQDLVEWANKNIVSLFK
jgi:hypothetical protein